MNTVTSSIYSLDFPALWAAVLSIVSIVGKALLVFIACRIAMKLLLRIFDNLTEKIKLEQSIKGFARSVIFIALWAVTVIIVAGTLGIETASLVALLSVASLALSLSVQNIITDAFSGVTILMSHPFSVGQFVEIAGVSGTVTAISIMRTTLLTGDRKEILIPNSEIISSKIINFSSATTRRVDMSFSASYDAPTELVKQALYEAMSADSRILPDPAPFVGLNAFNANDIEYVARAWCSSEDYWNVYFDMNERVREIFADKGIEFSFPHIIVHTEDK